MSSLNDNIAIVTGGAKGIGKGIVEALVQKGAYVIIADIDEESAIHTVDEYKQCEFYKVDLCCDKEVEKMFEYVADKYKKIDILVCNAGIQIRNWATEFEMDKFDAVLNLNLRAYYFCARTAARYMKESQKGSIICISSVNSVKYHSKRSAYNISKAAVNGLVGTLAVEWGRFGIKINAIAPGYVRTELMESGIKEGIIDEQNIMSIIPMKRYITTQEVGNVAAFLASDESNGVTGQVICVDGGWSVNALPEEKHME